MKTIYHIVNSARMRMQLNATLQMSVVGFVILSVAILVLTIFDRVGQTAQIPWEYASIFIAFATGMVLVRSWLNASVSTIEAATEVDARLGLRDRLSSALSSENESGPYCKAVVDDAIAFAQSQNVQSKIATMFPLALPKAYATICSLLVLSSVVLLMGQWDLLSGTTANSQNEQLATNESIESSIELVLEELQENELLSDSIQEELEALSATDVHADQDAESLRRTALKNITDVQKRLDELLNDESALAFEEMQQRMVALKIPSQASMQPMVADLKNSKFDDAKKEFESLQEQLNSEELSEEEKDQLKQSLEDLAKQLQELSESNEALASALSAAGMNANLADNMDAALKAIENSKELTEEQKKQLLELLKAQQTASEMCEKMGKSCKECAGGKPGEGMASELEKLQAMKMFQKQAKMAASACQNAAQSMCSGANGTNKGGTGGEGAGNGGNNPLKETETTTVAKKTPVQTLEGTIIARQLFKGGLLTTNDSNATVRETVLSQKRDSEQAIIDEEVPRKYHELLRHYFGQLEELTEPSDDDAETNK